MAKFAVEFTCSFNGTVTVEAVNATAAEAKVGSMLAVELLSDEQARLGLELDTPGDVTIEDCAKEVVEEPTA